MKVLGKSLAMSCVDKSAKHEVDPLTCPKCSGTMKVISDISEESKVVYRSKDDKKEKIFDALEWLAAMCSHVPNRGEQIVRYYG